MVNSIPCTLRASPRKDRRRAHVGQLDLFGPLAEMIAGVDRRIAVVRSNSLTAAACCRPVNAQRVPRVINTYHASAGNIWVSLRVTRKVTPR